MSDIHKSPRPVRKQDISATSDDAPAIDNPPADEDTCPDCKGSGCVDGDECDTCGGTGKLYSTW